MKSLTKSSCNLSSSIFLSSTNFGSVFSIVFLTALFFLIGFCETTGLDLTLRVFTNGSVGQSSFELNSKCSLVETNLFLFVLVIGPALFRLRTTYFSSFFDIRWLCLKYSGIFPHWPFFPNYLSCDEFCKRFLVYLRALVSSSTVVSSISS